MNQLNPNTIYQAVWQADAQNDPATYYPQAVIRYSNTGSIWKTVNLVSQGNQRYTAPWNTPTVGPDGAQLDMTLSVYEDAAHTVLSTVYATVNVQYLVQVIYSPSLGFSGGNDSLNKADIEVIIRRALDGQKPLYELSDDKVAEIIGKQMESNYNTHFHDIIMGIDLKYDGLSSEIKKIKGNGGRMSKKHALGINTTLQGLKSVAGQSEAFKEEIKGDIKSYIKELDKKLIKLEELDKSISKNHLAFMKELGKVFDKVARKKDDFKGEKERIKKSNVDNFLKNMKEQFESLSDYNSISTDEEESKGSKFAKSLLG